MPNGKPGDHPLTDIFLHGLHPFPADIEAMIRQLKNANPSILKSIENQFLRWKTDMQFDAARKALRESLEQSKPTSR